MKRRRPRFEHVLVVEDARTIYVETPLAFSAAVSCLLRNSSVAVQIAFELAIGVFGRVGCEYMQGHTSPNHTFHRFTLSFLSRRVCWRLRAFSLRVKLSAIRRLKSRNLGAQNHIVAISKSHENSFISRCFSRRVCTAEMIDAVDAAHKFVCIQLPQSVP